MEIFLIVLIACFVGIIFISGASKQKAEDARKQRHEREKVAAQERISQRESQKKAYEQSLSEYCKSYGSTSRIISMEEYDIDKQIIAFESSGNVLIMGDVYKMKSILGCELIDNSHIIKGKETIVTSADPVDTLGKMDAASMLFGRKTGNVLGAATAEKKTTVTRAPDRKIEDYRINITIDNLSKPIVTIDTKSRSKASEIKALMDIIVYRNSQPSSL